jgi:type IV secretory pathway VirB2 component (pilin)
MCAVSQGPVDGDTTPPASEKRGDRRRSIRRVLLVAEFAALALLASNTTAHADTVVLAIAGSVDEVLTNIRNWLMGILAALATVFLTIGGVRRVFGSGDPGEQEKAKEAFKAAGIGYALAALAPLVVTVLKGIVGA